MKEGLCVACIYWGAWCVCTELVTADSTEKWLFQNNAACWHLTWHRRLKGKVRGPVTRDTIDLWINQSHQCFSQKGSSSGVYGAMCKTVCISWVTTTSYSPHVNSVEVIVMPKIITKIVDYYNKVSWTGEMAHQFRELAALPEDLVLSASIHVAAHDHLKLLPQGIPSPLLASTSTHVAHTQ